MNARFLQIGSQKIAWHEGPGPSPFDRPKETPAVLFIHANSSSSLTFRKQFESGLAKKYRLVAIDLPGHGRSAPAADPETTYTLPGYASVLVEAAERLGLEDAVFVGWSLGGHILLEAAEHLSKASGFLIFGTPPAGNPPDMAKAFLPSPALPLLFKAELSNGEVETWGEALCKQQPEPFAADMRRTDGRARVELGRSIERCNYTDEVDVVANLGMPLAVLHGERDPLVSLKYIQELRIPNLWRGEVQVMPEACHAPHWEQPECFNALLEAFIGDIL